MDSGENWDVIVVGAGFSGLKAALELEKAGKRVLVLEARDRVGGRAMAGEVRGQTVDFGGQWVGPRQKLLLAQAQEFGVATRPQFMTGASLLSRDGKVHAYKSSTPKLPLPALIELALIERRWKREMDSLPADAPWRARRARQWDAASVESWVLANVRTGGARDFVRTVVGALLCVDTSQISYLFFLDCLRRGHGLQAMIGVEGGAQQDKFVGGAWQIAARMADRLHQSVAFNSPVRALEQDADGVRVTSDSGVHTARAVVMAIPPALASRIRFTPPLPVKRAGLLQRMPMGAVIKVHVAYDTPFWREEGLNGSGVSTDRALSVVFDQTPEDESVGMLVGLIEGRHAEELSALGTQERRKRVVADFVHYFGTAAANPVAYADQDWIAEEWSLGGYAASIPPGVMTTYGEALREPCGRIHWAGTETASENPGYLDGALQAGIRAASEIVARDK